MLPVGSLCDFSTGQLLKHCLRCLPHSVCLFVLVSTIWTGLHTQWMTEDASLKDIKYAMLASLLYTLYLSDFDELVNRECLRGLQMACVFHSHVPRSLKEERILWCVCLCVWVFDFNLQVQKEFSQSYSVFPGREMATKARERRDMSG